MIWVLVGAYVLGALIWGVTYGLKTLAAGRYYRKTYETFMLKWGTFIAERDAYEARPVGGYYRREPKEPDDRYQRAVSLAKRRRNHMAQQFKWTPVYPSAIMIRTAALVKKKVTEAMWEPGGTL